MKRFAALALCGVLTGCGGGPSEAPASLTSGLAKVDRLIAARDYAGARAALEDLVRRTSAAREAGSIDEARAERITAAAAQLGAALPRSVVTPSPKPSPAPREKADSDDGHSDGDERKGRGKGKKDDDD